MWTYNTATIYYKILSKLHGQFDWMLKVDYFAIVLELSYKLLLIYYKLWLKKLQNKLLY